MDEVRFDGKVAVVTGAGVASVARKRCYSRPVVRGWS